MGRGGRRAAGARRRGSAWERVGGAPLGFGSWFAAAGMRARRGSDTPRVWPENSHVALLPGGAWWLGVSANRGTSESRAWR
jgi:hypothetical protein